MFNQSSQSEKVGKDNGKQKLKLPNLNVFLQLAPKNTSLSKGGLLLLPSLVVLCKHIYFMGFWQAYFHLLIAGREIRG